MTYKVKRFSKDLGIRELLLKNYPSSDYSKLNKFLNLLWKESKKIYKNLFRYIHDVEEIIPSAGVYGRDEYLEWVDRVGEDQAYKDTKFNISILSFGDIDRIGDVELTFNLKSRSWTLKPYKKSKIEMGSKLDYNKFKEALTFYLARFLRNPRIRYEMTEMISYINQYQF